MTEYRYASGDLMRNPHTYFYTEFEGPSFLERWKQARGCVLDTLPEPGEAPPVDSEGEDTAALLESAYAEALAVETTRRPFPSRLETLLRKFEIGKRIYDAYDDEMKPIDPTRFRTHAHYVRAGECFEAAYARSGDLRALNVLLKCLDVLTAHAAELCRDLGARTARLIMREEVYVTQLAEDMGWSSNDFR